MENHLLVVFICRRITHASWMKKFRFRYMNFVLHIHDEIDFSCVYIAISEKSTINTTDVWLAHTVYLWKRFRNHDACSIYVLFLSCMLLHIITQMQYILALALALSLSLYFYFFLSFSVSYSFKHSKSRTHTHTHILEIDMWEREIMF